MASDPIDVPVTTSPTLLYQTSTGVFPDPAINIPGGIIPAGSENDPRPILVRNVDAAATVYLGGSTVTSSGAGVGTPLKANESLTFNVVGNDSLYAVAASGTVHVSVLAQRL